MEQRLGTPRQRTAGRGAGRGRPIVQYDRSRSVRLCGRPGTCNRTGGGGLSGRRLPLPLDRRRRPRRRTLAGRTRRHRRRVEIPPAQRPMRGTARRHRSGAALPAPHGSGLPRRLRAGGDRGVFGGRPPGRFGRHDAPRRGAPRLRRADLSRHYGRTGQMPQRVVRPLAGHRPHGRRRGAMVAAKPRDRLDAARIAAGGHGGALDPAHIYRAQWRADILDWLAMLAHEDQKPTSKPR